MTNSTKATLRRTITAVTIGSFSVAALLGVLALLGGGDFGESELRVLTTTVIVGCASIAVLSYLSTVETPYVLVGAFGGVAALVATGTALGLVWGSWDDGPGNGTLQLFGVTTVLAVTAAQVCLLLAVAARRRHLTVLLWGTVALAAVAAAIICSVIVSEDASDGVIRLLGVVLILDVLGTVVTMALAAFGAGSAAARPHPQDLTVRLPAELAARLQHAATAAGRTPDEVAADAVARHLAGLVD